MKIPRVGIILLNWKGYDVTCRCVESLRQMTYGNADVIIVDNGSPDGSGAKLRDRFPELAFVQTGANLGFSRGCNAGISAAMARGADYVLLLNNDTTVEPGFLEPLVAAAEADPLVGLVSGKIFLDGEKRLIWYGGGRISRVTGSVRIRNHFRPDDGTLDAVEETQACTGAMMLIRRRVLEQVGHLNDQYFFGQEEWDYSLTVARAGFKLVYCGPSVVHHLADGSHRNMDPVWVYCGARNRLIFQDRFLPGWLFPIWAIVYGIYVTLLAPIRLRHGRDDRRAFRRGYWAAFREHVIEGRKAVVEADLKAYSERYPSP